MKPSPSATPPYRAARPSAFTLIEILASCAVLAILMLVMAGITDQVQKTYKMTQGKAEQFREARIAFEAMTRRIALATLNTYWDYDNAAAPTRYLRQSELRFKCGGAASLLPNGANSPTHALFFQAPFGFTSDSSTYGGMETLLNTWGYFIEFGSDEKLRPPLLAAVNVPLRHRFRLFELMEPSEELSVYRHTAGNPFYNGMSWFRDPLAADPRPARMLAENVIALIFLPRDPNNAALTTDYGYDTAPDNSATTQPWSEHQLPPFLQVTMVAMDDASATRLAAAYGSAKPGMIQPQWFTEVSKYEEDLGWLRRQLSGEWNARDRVNYRIFTTNVSLRGAKWNRQ